MFKNLLKSTNKLLDKIKAESIYLIKFFLLLTYQHISDDFESIAWLVFLWFSWFWLWSVDDLDSLDEVNNVSLPTLRAQILQ